jgi:hypothetical protein
MNCEHYAHALFIHICCAVNNSMDFTSLSHGQVQSKIWLCESLEPYIPPNATIAILGSWYNVLGMMLLFRNPNKYNFILGIDKDPNVIPVADKICEGYMIQPNVKIKNVCADANTYNLQGYQVVINCSVEHMESNDWFNNLTTSTLVCIQSSNVQKSDDNFDIKSPNQSIDSLVEKFPCRKFYHKKTKNFQYNEWGYSRYMTIGLK